METSFIMTAVLWVGAKIVLTRAMLRYRFAAFLIFAAALIAIPFLSDTSRWFTWFAWAKRYSLVIPVCYWAWATWRMRTLPTSSKTFHWMRRLGFLIIILNVLEVAFKQFQASYHVNAVFLVLIAVLTPWYLERTSEGKLVGFRSWA